MIEKYTDWRDLWTERNDRYVRLVEQAGFDRNLFMNSKPNKVVEVKYPEYVLTVPCAITSLGNDAVLFRRLSLPSAPRLRRSQANNCS
jgi:hypothetical protein